jgi:rhodanese-related sulfurtransferase
MTTTLQQPEKAEVRQKREGVSTRRVTVAEAAVLMARPGMRVVDVRSPAEFAGTRVAGAESVPLDVLDPRAFGTGCAEGVGVLVFCQSGGRAGRAVERLAAAGVSGCAVVEGGMEGWIAAGLPVEQGGGRVLPLMRQVQMVVGACAAGGAALALAVDVRWAWVPLGIGCGLIFAGATGFCALAELLAKMPWNQRGAGSGVACASGPQASCCGSDRAGGGR